MAGLIGAEERYSDAMSDDSRGDLAVFSWWCDRSIDPSRFVRSVPFVKKSMFVSRRHCEWRQYQMDE